MISIQADDFDLAREYQRLRECSGNAGAIVTFCGLVRDFQPGDPQQLLQLEHYPGMTEKTLQDICVNARTRWQIERISIIHRVGQLQHGDQIVFVGVSGKHRYEAFQACEFIMDFLKTQAPFWKKEITSEGGRWVDARDSDNRAAGRWLQDHDTHHSHD